jgi:two-component system sensor histidine kinase BaeS
VVAGPGTISVQDNGPGLSAEDLPRAFERFYLQGRYGQQRPLGSGLGLAIVRELTEAMGGRVSVASRPGVGTNFVVLLPASTEEPDP